MDVGVKWSGVEWSGVVVGRWFTGGHRSPDEAGELAGDRDADDGRHDAARPDSQGSKLSSPLTARNVTAKRVTVRSR
jgi:hypothetical protein